MSDFPENLQLVEQTGTEAAERKRWNDHFARPSTRTCCNFDCRQGRDCPQRRPQPDRVDSAAKFLQGLAIVGFFGCLLLAIF